MLLFYFQKLLKQLRHVFFLCTSAAADVPNRSGASHDVVVHPQRWGGHGWEAPPDQTGPHTKDRENWKCLCEMLTGHLKSITCPCRSFLLFFCIFFYFHLLCVALSFLRCIVIYKRLLKQNRHESMCLDRRRVSLLTNKGIAANFSFGASLLPKVCKLPAFYPRGLVLKN